jgi:tRNA(Ile)-lysidine synthase
VLLAHHADDQAETMLLQLVRGAGPRGLAAMPEARLDDGVWWLRPLLQLPRSVIDDHVAQRALAHIEDETNAQPRYRRNALRTAVVPALRTIAPGYPATLVRAAELQADAAALLDDLALVDVRGHYDGRTLDRALFASLDARRGGNVLRWFLREQRLPAPSRARLAEAVRQLRYGGAGARIAIRHGGVVLGVHQGRLVVHPVQVEPFRRAWDNAARWVMPHGTLTFSLVSGTGVAARHVAAGTVTIRSGVDGERLRMPGRSARRNVADLLREAGVPHWDRRAVPRIYCGDALAAVAAIGADAAFAAAPGETGCAWDWRPAYERA